jgi:hypothetical protein
MKENLLELAQRDPGCEEAVSRRNVRRAGCTISTLVAWLPSAGRSADFPWAVSRRFRKSDITGLAAGALAGVAERNINGIVAGGLAVVAEDGIQGAVIRALAVVSNGAVSGVATTVGRIHADSLRGIAFGSYRVTAQHATGIITSIARNDLVDVSGLSVAACNRARSVQRGMAIGLFSNAEICQGVQIGILNRAANNTGILRIVPLVNVHFE